MLRQEALSCSSVKRNWRSENRVCPIFFALQSWRNVLGETPRYSAACCGVKNFWFPKIGTKPQPLSSGDAPAFASNRLDIVCIKQKAPSIEDFFFLGVRCQAVTVNRNPNRWRLTNPNEPDATPTGLFCQIPLAINRSTLKVLLQSLSLDFSLWCGCTTDR
jgi:hypothetical protein